VSMNGQEVYKFAVRTVPKVIAGAVEAAGFSMDEIDFFLLHQANLRIIEAVAKRLHQPMEKFPTNLQKYGNISSASVPILLDNVNNHGMIGEGSKIVLALEPVLRGAQQCSAGRRCRRCGREQILL